MAIFKIAKNGIWSKKLFCEIDLQQVLDYRDLDYRDPCNTGIHKKFHLFDYREILEIPGDLNSRYFKEFPIIKYTKNFIMFTNCTSLDFGIVLTKQCSHDVNTMLT